jgi:Cu/Ag efflux pump CusA
MCRASWRNCKRKVDARLTLPVGYYTTYGGTFENLDGREEASEWWWCRWRCC